MLKRRHQLLPLFACLWLCSACTSKLILQSDPPEADILLSTSGQKDKVKAGKTPLELTEKQLADMLKLTPQRTDLIEVTFEKADRETRTILLPSNRWGELTKTVKVELSPRENEGTTVTRLLRHLFNARKFAESRQYDQAHAEIDRALQLDSTLAQAMVMKGSVYFLQGQTTEAEAWYKKALEKDPSQSEAVQMLEKIRNRKGNSPS
ncbi:MAG: tetratricopeptide repeat protein [Bdellovibrionaceae bacterium]|nr:tetratricopeptide repeat protein [Pseudobdellovibrionaceae bacterium]MBX3033413.1 tetratricopeptide repeat protein [Pseudobdellovibrionaceae bacterium]